MDEIVCRSSNNNNKKTQQQQGKEDEEEEQAKKKTEREIKNAIARTCLCAYDEEKEARDS